MKILESIKKSRMNCKVPIFVVLCYCFLYGLGRLIICIKYRSAYTLGWLAICNCIFSFISIIVFGIYIFLFFGMKEYTIMPIISIGLHCITDIIFIIVSYDSFRAKIILDCIVIIGYCILVYCCICGFNNKKSLLIFAGITFISVLISNLMGSSGDPFSVFLLIFGLTNEIYPISKKQREYVDITFELSELKSKYEQGILTDEEYKELKRTTIEKL